MPLFFFADAAFAADADAERAPSDDAAILPMRGLSRRSRALMLPPSFHTTSHTIARCISSLISHWLLSFHFLVFSAFLHCFHWEGIHSRGFSEDTQLDCELECKHAASVSFMQKMPARSAGQPSM
jgi:hypothetical protein